MTTVKYQRQQAHHARRAAIAINNTSVALLEAGLFSEARDSFKEALLIRQRYCQPSTMESGLDADDSYDTVSSDAAVNRALSALFTKTRPSKEVDTTSSTCPHLKVLTYRTGQSLDLPFAAGEKSPFSADTVFPVRIEADDSDQDVAEAQLELESMILLLNVSCTHTLIAATSETPPAAANPSDSAAHRRNWQKAHAASRLAFRGLECIQNQVDYADVLHENTISALQIEALVLHSLISVLRHCGAMEELTEDYQQRLLELLRTMDMVQAFVRLVDSEITASAA